MIMSLKALPSPKTRLYVEAISLLDCGLLIDWFSCQTTGRYIMGAYDSYGTRFWDYFPLWYGSWGMFLAPMEVRPLHAWKSI